MTGLFPAGTTNYTNPNSTTDKTGLPVGGRTLDQFIADHSDDLENVMNKLGNSLATPADSPVTDRLLGSDANGKSGWMQLRTGMVPSGLITAAMLADGVSTTKKIAETTLGSSSALITFSSIPATYRSLRLAWAARTDASTSTAIYLRLNNDTGANYNYQILSGSGSTASAFAGTAQSIIYLGEMTRTASAANEWAHGWVEIFDYAGTNHFKTTFGQNTRNQEIYATAGQWSSTAAVNRIDILANAGVNFITGSRFTFWGLPA